MELKITETSVAEEGGKLKVRGTAEYQLQKDKLWDKIKSYSGWENDIAADIKVAKTEVYGYYTVKSGDSLSKIAKDVYDNAGQYKKIYEANKDTIGPNPDLIKPGQKLTIPNRSLRSPSRGAWGGGLGAPPDKRTPRCLFPLSVVRSPLSVPRRS